jgi:hypothetical protein
MPMFLFLSLAPNIASNVARIIVMIYLVQACKTARDLRKARKLREKGFSS